MPYRLFVTRLECAGAGALVCRCCCFVLHKLARTSPPVTRHCNYAAHNIHTNTRQSRTSHKHREHHNNTYRQLTHQFDLMAVIFAIFCVRTNNFIMCFCYLDPLIVIHESVALYVYIYLVYA